MTDQQIIDYIAREVKTIDLPRADRYRVTTCNGGDVTVDIVGDDFTSSLRHAVETLSTKERAVQ